MNNIASVSQGELSQRRSMLRRHRRLKQLQSIWRTVAIGGLLGGLVWGATQPIWVIRESQQINVIGNKLLSKQTIQSFVKISYPQTLLEIKPEALAQSLEAQPTIADASVTRKLFPPSLTVQVTERIPVAVALIKNSPPGLIAEDGVWIPQQSYASPHSTAFKMPKLIVVGQIEQYKPHWHEVYQAVSNLKVKVSEIDWQNPSNLILKTELGTVYLGAYSSKLSVQLQALEELRRLPTQMKPQEIAYINLTNPTDPSVQMTSAAIAQLEKKEKKLDKKPSSSPQLNPLPTNTNPKVKPNSRR